MDNVVKNFNLVKEEISNFTNANIVAVSKTFPISHILPLINYGHHHFGENKVQEALEKWTSIKNDFPQIKLHLIGKLQTNKVKFALPLFDYIHSLDSFKLAEKISSEQKKKNFKPKIFIQINLGKEDQKSGIKVSELDELLFYCESLKLNVIGLMCIPPISSDTKKYFRIMRELKEKYNQKNLSMGMSSDYMDAVEYSSNFLRIGTSIFGERS